MLVMLDPTTGHAGFHAGSARIPTRDQRAVLGHSRSPTGSPHPPGARSAWEVPWVAVWGRGAPGDPPRGPPFHDALLRCPQMMHSLSPTSWLQPPHPHPPSPTSAPHLRRWGSQALWGRRRYLSSSRLQSGGVRFSRPHSAFRGAEPLGGGGGERGQPHSGTHTHSAAPQHSSSAP